MLLTAAKSTVRYFSGRFMFLFFFSFDAAAQQWLDGFSPNLHQNVDTPTQSAPPPKKNWGAQTSIF